MSVDAGVLEGDKCPRCGSRVLYGYGLTGGGCGPYKVCSGDNDDECTFFEKTQDVDEQEQPL